MINLKFPRIDISNAGGYHCTAYCKCDYVAVYDGSEAKHDNRLGNVFWLLIRGVELHKSCTISYILNLFLKSDLYVYISCALYSLSHVNWIGTYQRTNSHMTSLYHCDNTQQIYQWSAIPM